MSSYLFLGFGRDVAKAPWYVTPCSAAVAAISSLVVMENGTGSTEGRIAIVRWRIDLESTTWLAPSAAPFASCNASFAREASGAKCPFGGEFAQPLLAELDRLDPQILCQ